MKTTTLAATIELLLLVALVVWPPARAFGERQFKVEPGRIPAGRVHHYILTNHDGTNPEYISTFFPDSDSVEAFKFHFGEPPAAHVTATMDWETFSPKRIVSRRVVPGRRPVIQATLRLEREGKSLVSDLPQLGILDHHDPLPPVPFYVYPFDLISMSMALPHLASPEDGFTFGVVDANRTGTGTDVMRYLGKVQCRYVGSYRRDGYRVREYSVLGPDDCQINGRFWVDVDQGHLVEILLDRPPNPNWSTFRLKLLSFDQFQRDDWLQFQSEVLRPQPELTQRDHNWRRDIGELVNTIERTHPNPSHRRMFVEARAHSMDTIHRIPRLSDSELRTEVQRILAMVGDGHTTSLFGSQPDAEQVRLPVEFYRFEDGLFVVAADESFRSMIGNRVIRIGKRSAHEASEELQSYVSCDNASGRRVGECAYLTQLDFLRASGTANSDADLRITLEDENGSTRIVKLPFVLFPADTTTGPFDPPSSWPRLGPIRSTAKKTGLFSFKKLGRDDTVYCRIDRIGDNDEETLDDFARRLMSFVDVESIDRLILDLRHNSGGDNTKSQLLFELIRDHPRLNQSGGLFVLIGRRTFSAAQNLATKLNVKTHAIFVGEPSGSRPNHFGETTIFTLPHSRIRYSVSSKHWRDAPESDHRQWIEPDIAVAEQSADRAGGRDQALEATIRYIAKSR